MDIISVTKVYMADGINFTYQVVIGDLTLHVPHDENNNHYQEILKWVAEGNTITDNGGGE